MIFDSIMRNYSEYKEENESDSLFVKVFFEELHLAWFIQEVSMSNFQKIYDEEFYLICNLPKTAGIFFDRVFLDMQAIKIQKLRRGTESKPVILHILLLSSFTGNSERQIREGVKQLKEYLILDTYLEGRRNIYRLCYPIGMEKIQELIEEIQEENTLYIQKIQEEKCKIIGGKVYTIQEEKCIQHRRKSVSKNVIDLKDHIVTENENKNRPLC